MFKALAIAGFSLSSLVISNVAQADWQLVNDKSQLSFVSIKKIQLQRPITLPTSRACLQIAVSLV